MGAFGQLIKSKTVAARSVVVLPPSAFADTYTRRPSAPQKIGIRLVSEDELSRAQKEAAEIAWREYPQNTDVELRLEVFNDYLMTNVLAQVVVFADDSNSPFFSPAPEAIIRSALTPGGIRRLWDVYHSLSIADGQLTPEATDEELLALGASVVNLESGAATRIRKLARALLDEIARSS